jgi:glycosyltransferase involved in cell wall biosynthesis
VTHQHVVFFDDTAVVGGHQISAVTAARLLQRTHRVTFVVSTANERLAELLREAGVAVVTIAPPPRLHAVRAIFGTGEVRRVLRELRPDVVVAVQGNILLATRGIQAARREGLRAVSFIPMALGSPRSARDRVWAAIGRYYYRRPDAFITTSKSAAEALRRSGVRSPIHLAYYGPDLASLRPVARVESSTYTIAIIGRVVFSHKGHDVLLRALPRLPDVRLLVVGDGPDDARLDTLARELGVTDRIERVAWTNDMAPVYAAANLIALPSRFEGLPLVMLEAMYARLPIVASAVDGMLEVLPPDWLFPAEDVEALVRTIARLRANDLSEAIERNYRLIVEQMNAERFGEAFARGLSEEKC